MERIIITGGAGFVGSNLALTIQQRHPKCRVVIIDDFRSGSFANLVPIETGKSAFRGEMIARPLSQLDLYEIVEDFDPQVVFHLASITDTTVTDQAKMITDNADPFDQLLGAALERGFKLVWASSAATYGTAANGATAAKRPFKLDDAGQPANVYGFSKWVMENMMRHSLSHVPEAHVVGLRYFNVFGPGEQHKGKMASMVYQLAMQMLAGHQPRIFTDGSQARDQVYVKDVVEATLAAADERAVSGVYNVGSGKATSFNDIIAAINEALGSSYQPQYIDNPYSFYQDYTCADVTATKKALGWSPQHEPRKAIIEYVRWLKEHQR